MSTERALAVREVVVPFDGFTEHEEDLVTVQDSHPVGPWVRLVPLGEVVRVGGQPDGRVAASELVDGTDELTVACRHVERVYVLVVVFWVQPVRILKLQHAVIAMSTEYR